MSEQSTDQVQEAVGRNLRQAFQAAVELAELAAMRGMEYYRGGRTDGERGSRRQELLRHRNAELPFLRQSLEQHGDIGVTIDVYRRNYAWMLLGDQEAARRLAHLHDRIEQRYGDVVPGRPVPPELPGAALWQAGPGTGPEGRPGPAVEPESERQPRSGPDRGVGDALGQRLRDEEAALTASDETVAGLVETRAGREGIGAEAGHASELRRAADQDRGALAALESVADRDAAAAVGVAAAGFRGTPAERLAGSRTGVPRQGPVPQVARTRGAERVVR